MDFTCSSSLLHFSQAHEIIPAEFEGSLLHEVQNQFHRNDPDLHLQAFLNTCGSEQLFPPSASETSTYATRKGLVMKQSYEQDSWWAVRDQHRLNVGEEF